MAVKKTSKTEETSASPKATKRSGTTKAAAPKENSEAPAVASETAAKSATPKGGPKKASAPKAEAAPGAGAKKAGELKLNDRQREFLKKIGDAGEGGYLIGQKVEQRTIDALKQRGLLKRGAKHKESGAYHYLLTKDGKKHLGSLSATDAQ